MGSNVVAVGPFLPQRDPRDPAGTPFPAVDARTPEQTALIAALRRYERARSALKGRR
ncbi:MAG TPA: hypothetical protein VF838_02235 [Trebonia sp.]